MASGSGSSYTQPRAPKKKRPTVSKFPTYEEEIEEEEEAAEVMPAKTTKRYRTATGAKGKQNVKTTTSGPQKTMKQISLKQFAALRGVNPYVSEKNTRMCPNPRFYTKDQERIFNEVFAPKKKRFCAQYSINTAHLDANPEYFGEAKAICEEFGLLPLMEFNQAFDEELIAQFFATVNFGDDDGVRNLTWMTHDRVMHATWEEFANGLGYSDLPIDAPGIFRVHLKDKPMSKSKLAELYIPGRALVGSAYDLLPTYDIMLRIYRSVLNPKVGNFDQIHGFLVDLLVLTADMKGRGLQLDVMDYIWHEMYYAVVMRKTPPYAPYVMKLLIKKWEDADFGDLTEQCGRLTIHPVKGPLIKTHKKPRFGPGAEEEEIEDEDDPEFAAPTSKIKKWFKKLTSRVKASFCFKQDLQDRMYYQHQQDKKSRQRQKAIMRKLDLPVSDGSENAITDKELWVSSQQWPESEASTPEDFEPWTTSPPAADDDESEADE